MNTQTILYILNTYWPEYNYSLCFYKEQDNYICKIYKNINDALSKDNALKELVNELKDCIGKPGIYLFKNNNLGEKFYNLSLKISNLDIKKFYLELDFN